MSILFQAEDTVVLTGEIVTILLVLSMSLELGAWVVL